MSLGSIFGLSAEQLRKNAAWAATRTLPALGAMMYPKDARMDELGNVICYSEYGQSNSQYGWEIDHRHPSALGGVDHHSNLRALKCQTNRSLGAILGQDFR